MPTRMVRMSQTSGETEAANRALIFRDCIRAYKACRPPLAGSLRPLGSYTRAGWIAKRRLAHRRTRRAVLKGASGRQGGDLPDVRRLVFH